MKNNKTTLDMGKSVINDKFLHSHAAFKPKKIAYRTSALYLLVGTLWVFLSDKLLLSLVKDKQMVSAVSTAKGWTFVLATGIILYFLIKITLSKIQSINHELLRNYKTLAGVHRELELSEQELQKQIGLLTSSEERYRLISESTNDGIWNIENGERKFSERWFEITGYSKRDLEGIGDWMSLIHPDDIGEVKKTIEENTVNRESNYRCEYRLRCKDGNYLWVLSRARLIYDKNGDLIKSAGSHTDITALKRYEQQLKQLAYEDHLTNLPNRTAFYETVKLHLDNYSDGSKALIFIDIDNFKYINDTLGHVFGDMLIAEIGKRLLTLTDSGKSIYRIGGDEFIMFVPQYEAEEEVESYAKTILQSLNTSFRVSKFMLNITVSLGIALYPIHGKDVDTLLKCADMAMYKAKATAHGKYAFYNEDMEQKFLERMTLENELRKALERNEFSLCYQPQMDIISGKINSMEALLRWNSKKLGSVSPLKFISIAEETNLISPIGDWVLLNACSFLKKLHNQGYSDLSVSVNVSIIQLMQQDFCEKVLNILSEADIKPEFIELEITESVLMESYEGIKEKLIELKSKGIQIALDDFGKGYSSLSYLTNIPLNTLKIDKTFIDSILTENDDTSLTNMIIMIGRSLGLSIVAEGVETENQLMYLKKHNCHKIQGYYFSKPLTKEEIIDLLSQNTGNASSQEI